LRVILEICDGDEWWGIATVGPEGPPGSFSSTPPAGRQIIVFGWLDGQGPGVWASTAGIDVEVDMARLVASMGMTQVGYLTVGPYALTAFTEGGRTQREVRVRYDPD
jgi:hypothetical protein